MTTATNTPHVAVVVLTWNGLDDVTTCLESFVCVEYPNYNVLVVDNGSEDSSVAVVRERYPWVTLIENGTNLGSVGGSNVGIRYALGHGADYVFILNNDTKMTPHVLTELVRVLESDPRIGIAGAKNLLMADPSQTWGKYGVLSWGPMLASVVGRDQPDRPEASPKDVDWVIGNGCMMSRDALQCVGVFDEEFFQVHEDIDWSTRALSLGYRVVYVDTAAIYHRGAGSADLAGCTRFNYGYLLGRNSILFARKHATGSQWIKLLAMMTAGLALRMGVGILQRILFALPGHTNYVRAIMDGFAGRLRLEYAFSPTRLKGRLAYHQVDPPWA